MSNILTKVGFISSHFYALFDVGKLKRKVKELHTTNLTTMVELN